MKTPSRGLLGLAATCFAVTAFSQTSENKDTFQQKANNANVRESSQRKSVEEIIVTAQRRGERIQDVPILMSVLNSEQLEGPTIQTVNEALSRVPGVFFNKIDGGAVQISLRGVSAQAAIVSGSSTAAYYLDSVPFGFAKSARVPDPDAYDLERVEVLRGPQGTLYGANALSGVVRVLTHDANPNELEFKARALTSTTKDGGEIYRGDAAFNVPLVEGKLAARAVVGYQSLGGWIDKPNEKDANDGEASNVRLKINAQPTEQLSIGLSAWRSRSDYDAPSTGLDSAHTAVPGDEPGADDFNTYGLKVGYEFPSFALTSATSYLDYTSESLSSLEDRGLPRGVTYDAHDKAHAFAQEVYLASTRSESWRWSLGGMYRDSEDSSFALLTGLVPGSSTNTSKSYAVFGELTRLLLGGQLELTAGLRYFEDEIGLIEHSRFFVSVPPEQLQRQADTVDALTPRFVLAWHPNDQVMAYASYGEGFRSGVQQSGTVLAAASFPPAEPDELKNYEIGAKGSVLDGRLAFDTALYYLDWQDAQLSLFVPLGVGTLHGIAVVNAASASGVGVDFGITTRPVDGFELGVNVNWNDLTLDNDVISNRVVLFSKGDRLNFSPEYTGNAWASYAFPLGSSGFEGQLAASANYTSETKATLESLGTVHPNVGDSILLGRASFSLRAPEHWTATLFVDNVNDEKDSPYQIEGLPSRKLQLRPRTFGLQLEYRYGR